MLSLPNASFVPRSTEFTNTFKLSCVFLAVCSFLKGPQSTGKLPRTIARAPALQFNYKARAPAEGEKTGGVIGWPAGCLGTTVAAGSVSSSQTLRWEVPAVPAGFLPGDWGAGSFSRLMFQSTLTWLVSLLSESKTFRFLRQTSRLQGQNDLLIGGLSHDQQRSVPYSWGGEPQHLPSLLLQGLYPA